MFGPYPNILWSPLGSLLVDNFSDEEGGCVGVILESFHHAKDMFHVLFVIGFRWLSLVQAAIRDDVYDHVDAGSIEDGSAVIVIGAGVHVVDMNGIDLTCAVSIGHESNTSQGTHTQPLHQGGIPQTGIFVIAEGIIILASRLVTRGMGGVSEHVNHAAEHSYLTPII